MSQDIYLIPLWHDTCSRVGHVCADISPRQGKRSGRVTDMSIIVYAEGGHPSAVGDLLRVVRSKASREHIEMIDSFDGLKERLRRLPRRINAAVLLAATHDGLAGLVSLREFLSDTPLILILPDQEKGTIAQASRLCPKFTSTVDSDFNVVGAVLGRMLELWGTRAVG